MKTASVMSHKILENLKILCVDDSEDSLALITLALEFQGAEVTACCSAEDALVEIKASKYDVIVSDLDMPGMDGYDLAHALRAGERKEGRSLTPTMAVSSNANVFSVKRHFADFQVYMTKPFNQMNLVNMVERLAEADGDAVKSGSLAALDKAISLLNGAPDLPKIRVGVAPTIL